MLTSHQPKSRIAYPSRRHPSSLQFPFALLKDSALSLSAPLPPSPHRISSQKLNLARHHQRQANLSLGTARSSAGRPSTMVSVTSAAFAALSVAFIAILFPFLDDLRQSVPDTSMSTPAASPSMLDAAVQIVLLLALFTGVALVHRRLLHPTAAGAATELAALILCSAVGLLQFSLFVQPAGDAVVLVADALLVVAVGTFFLGITLVIAHIRAGGEGGGTAVESLKKMALAAAAVLVIQMAMVTLYHYKKPGLLRQFCRDD